MTMSNNAQSPKQTVAHSLNESPSGNETSHNVRRAIDVYNRMQQNSQTLKTSLPAKTAEKKS